MREFKKPDREPDLEVEARLFATEEGGPRKTLVQGCRFPQDFGLPNELNDGIVSLLECHPTKRHMFGC